MAALTDSGEYRVYHRDESSAPEAHLDVQNADTRGGLTVTTERVRPMSLRDSDMGDEIFDGDECHCDWCGGPFSSPAECWLGRHFTCAAEAQQVRAQRPTGWRGQGTAFVSDGAEPW